MEDESLDGIEESFDPIGLEEIEIREVTLDDISFRDKTLTQWEDHFTVKMPPLPCSSEIMNQTIATLNNRFQDAFNCFIEFHIMNNDLARRLKDQSDKKISEKITELLSKGVKKPPARETVATMVSGDKTIRAYSLEIQKISTIKDFFEFHKDKLGRMMQLANSLSVNVGASDRMFHQSHRTNGM